MQGYASFGKVKTIVIPSPIPYTDSALDEEEVKNLFGLDLRDIFKPYCESSGIHVNPDKNTQFLMCSDHYGLVPITHESQSVWVEGSSNGSRQLSNSLDDTFDIRFILDKDDEFKDENIKIYLMIH